MTANKNVITADEIAECLGVSKSSAYKIMHTLNKGLKAKRLTNTSTFTTINAFNSKQN